MLIVSWLQLSKMYTQESRPILLHKRLNPTIFPPTPKYHNIVRASTSNTHQNPFPQMLTIHLSNSQIIPNNPLRTLTPKITRLPQQHLPFLLKRLPLNRNMLLNWIQRIRHLRTRGWRGGFWLWRRILCFYGDIEGCFGGFGAAFHGDFGHALERRVGGAHVVSAYYHGGEADLELCSVRAKGGDGLG